MGFKCTGAVVLGMFTLARAMTGQVNILAWVLSRFIAPVWFVFLKMFVLFHTCSCDRTLNGGNGAISAY
jgi:hypothetical protein